MLSRLQKLKILVGFIVVTFVFGMGKQINRQNNEEKVEKYSLTVKKSIKSSSSFYAVRANQLMYHRKGKIVIILSNQRSGSSFVGDFFANNNNGFYLYEPLHPYGMSCDTLNLERLNLLKDMSQCDFSNLRSAYRNAFLVNNVRTHGECLNVNLCSPTRHKQQLHRYSSLCRSTLDQDEKDNEETRTKTTLGLSKPCSFPLNLTTWSSVCHSSDIVAFKVLRVCSLESLQNITTELEKLGNEVFVIELVRDPRGIINSALGLELRKEAIDKRLDQVCGKYKENIEYTEKESKSNEASNSKMLSKYMLIRYEDIAANPIAGAKRIYNFVGMELPMEVKKWIEVSTTDPGEKIENLRYKLKNESVPLEEQVNIVKKMAALLNLKNNPYGTMRDSKSVIVKWRKSLSMEIINKIQSKCSYVMEKLGYKTIKNAEERDNLTMKVW